MIHFCANQIIWECGKLVASETFPANYRNGVSVEEAAKWERMTDKPWPIRQLLLQSRSEFYSFWRRFIEIYSKGEFTVHDDRVPAVAGIAQVLGRISGDHCMFGCWLQNIHRDLLWSYHFKGGYVGPIMSIPKERRAPSWSWLSVDGRVTFNWRRGYVEAVAEVKISNIHRDGRSETPAEYNCAGPITPSASGLVVESPLYSIRHKLWTGAELTLGEQEKHDGKWPGCSWESRFKIKIDAREVQKPTGPKLDRQHLLRWASPTHLLPLTKSEYGVQGLLIVEDPEKADVFVRVGCFERSCSSDWERKVRAVFGCDGFDRDPDELARAGLYFLGTKRIFLE